MKCALPGCGKEFTSPYPRQRFCCKGHQVKWNNQQAALRNGVKKHYKSKNREPAPRYKPIRHQPKPKRQVMTDEQQRAINKAIDAKYHVKCETRIIKGKEFQELSRYYIALEAERGRVVLPYS